ncbi:hypothetical protein ACRRTK_006662 [Alexandromys fortis]
MVRTEQDLEQDGGGKERFCWSDLRAEWSAEKSQLRPLSWVPEHFIQCKELSQGNDKSSLRTQRVGGYTLLTSLHRQCLFR